MKEKIKKLNKILFLLGRFLKRIEIKENKIVLISFYSAIEDYSFVKEIISEDVIPLLNNRGIYIDYGKRIINIFDDKGNYLVAREFDLSVANQNGHTKLGEIIFSY